MGTPDLIKEPKGNMKQRKRHHTAAKNDTIEDTVSENVTDSSGYLIILPDEHNGNNTLERDRGDYMNEDNENEQPGTAGADEHTINKKTNTKRDESENDNKYPARSSSCVIDVDQHSYHSDSEIDEMSSSDYYNQRKALDDIEYQNEQWTKSFKELQKIFQPKKNVHL